MAASFSVTVDVKDVERKLSAFKKQIPFATARALTKTAQQASADVRQAIAKAFDRPTPFTLNAFYAKPARKTDLTASVESRDYAPKGRPASKYLAPEIEGTTRGMKGFERALAALSGGQFIVPGRGATLDQYGNISRGQLVQILSRLGAMRDPTANISPATRARLKRKGMATAVSGSEYFIAMERGTSRPLGVWKLIGTGIVVPVLVFTRKQPSYSVRLPFDKIVNESVSKNWERCMDEAIGEALATARAD